MRRTLPAGVEIIDTYDAFEGPKVVLARKCNDCKFPYERPFMYREVLDWINMKPVQEAFPDVHKDWRELFFLSGTCGTCWDKKFTLDDQK